MKLRHDGLQPLPPVEMGPLRLLTKLVHALECHEAGEEVASDGRANPSEPSWHPRGDPEPGLLLSGVSEKLANLHNAIKRLATHPLELWERDPLVIRRESEMYHRETEE